MRVRNRRSSTCSLRVRMLQSLITGVEKSVISLDRVACWQRSKASQIGGAGNCTRSKTCPAMTPLTRSTMSSCAHTDALNAAVTLA